MYKHEYLAVGLLSSLGFLGLATAAQPQGAGNSEQAVDDTEEVVVTGSRVITNGNDSPSPVTVVTLEDLQASRPTTVFEALQELPQFAAGRGGSLGGSTGQGSNNNSIASLNLRALGSLRGLVLFDGHRVAPQNADGQVDLNQIPQLLLQRVDVATGGASAVYGSDAISGVVNFISNRSFEGMKANVQYGVSDRNDNQSHELAFAYGRSLFDGRGHISASIQSHNDDGLLREDRDYVQRRGMGSWNMAGNGTAAQPYFLTQDLRDISMSVGGRILGPATVGTTANPLIAQGLTNFSANGVLSAFVPGSTQGFLTGNNRIGGQGGIAQQRVTLKTPIDLVQLYGRFDFDINDNLHYFASVYNNIEHQFSYLVSSRSNVSANTSFPGGFFIGVDNPYLSATYANQLRTAGFSSIRVGKIWEVDSYPTGSFDYHIRNMSLNTGLEGEFGDDWQWEASVTRSRNVQANTAHNTWHSGRLIAALDAVTPAGGGSPVCWVSTQPALASLYPGCVPMNILGPTATSMDAWNYVSMPTRYESTTDLANVSGSIAGSPFNSWAGPINMAVSGEWRKLEYVFLSGGEPQNNIALSCAPFTGRPSNCVAPSANNPGTSITFANGSAGTPLQQPVSQTVKELALEAEVPILKDLPIADQASLLLAVRRADYSSVGRSFMTDPRRELTFASTTWKVGLNWQVNDTLTLRATRSRDFRAPNLGDLFLPGRTQGFNLGTDRLTGATAVATVQQIGGNPDLQPEVGNTITAGLVIRPTESFSLAIDAYDINISNAITIINGADNNLQDICHASLGASAFCALQQRPFSYTNTTTANNATLWRTSHPFNFAEIHTQGADIEANFQMTPGGRPLRIRTLLSYQPHVWTSQPFSPTLDSSGVSTPRNRLFLSANYSFTNQLSVDWSTRWRSTLRNVDPRAIANNVLPGSADVKAASFSNVTLTYKMSQFSFGDVTSYLNILNVFDKVPPVYAPAAGGALFGQAAGTGGVGYYPADDAVGRYFNIGVKASF